MSSYGTASVGVVVVGVPVLLVAGTGVLVVRGVMWCGQKIEENYQAACQEWSKQQADFIAESRMNTETINSCVQLYVAQASTASYLAQQAAIYNGTANTHLPPGGPSASQQELHNILAQARTMLMDASRTAEIQPDIERALREARLRGEIASGRASLPPALIAEAEQTINGTSEQMLAVLNRIDGAWVTLDTERAQRRQGLRIITEAEAQLVAISQMLQEMEPSGISVEPLLAQRRQVERAVAEARSHLISQPSLAWSETQIIEQTLKPMLDGIVENIYQAWESVRVRLNEQKGMLAILELMIEEAKGIALVDEHRLEQLKKRVEIAQDRTDQALKLAPAESARYINSLTQYVATLKSDIFNEVKENQQNRVAHTIQETLEELGYGSQEQGTLTLQTNGRVLLVEAMVAQDTGEEEAKDRLLSFKITRDGQIGYDFSGYVGEQCMSDAHKIFSALLAKGLVVLDDRALEALTQLPAEQINASTLQQERYQITLEQNKTQAFLAEKVHGVLKQMGYSQVHESVVGGSIELEAFEGSIGYRVVLTPQGETKIYTEDAGNISHDQSDPLVAKVLGLQQQQDEVQTEREKARKQRGTIRRKPITY